MSIDLSSIKNKKRNKENLEYKQIQVEQRRKLDVPRKAKNTLVDKNEVEKEVHKNLVPLPSSSETCLECTPLMPHQRDKRIAILNLYCAEFPEKLSKYKSKQFSKMSDAELIKLQTMMQKEITTSSSLGMITKQSKKALELYEYFMVNYAEINIRGISKLGDSQEYKDCVKAVLLKYMSDFLVSVVKPECRLVISSSIMAHANNSLNENQQRVNIVESKAQVPESDASQVVKNLEL
jgi:hypothetical protein